MIELNRKDEDEEERRSLTYCRSVSHCCFFRTSFRLSTNSQFPTSNTPAILQHPRLSTRPKKKYCSVRDNKSDRVQTSDAFWRAARVLVFCFWCNSFKFRPFPRNSDQPTDRRTDGHALLLRCENASKEFVHENSSQINLHLTSMSMSGVVVKIRFNNAITK